MGPMERRACADTGPSLSVLGLGCWPFGGGDYWGPSDVEEVTRLVRQARDWGINTFDTAEMYNEGRSEEFLGKALKGIDRDQVIVNTKVWPTHLHPHELRASCEASLKRLALDYVDLYMIHWPLHERSYPLFADLSKLGVAGQTGAQSSMPRLEDVLDTLLKLQAEGKIRSLGLSNYGVERLQEIQGLGGTFAVDQVAYSLLSRAAEAELMPYCAQTGVKVMAYMVLMQGLLTDRYTTLDEIPDWYTRTRHFNCQRNPKTRHGESGAEDLLTQALQDIRRIAKNCGCTTAELSLQWVIANPNISCALVGTQSLESLEKNVKAAKVPLAAEIVEQLNAATLALKQKLGPGLDIFESSQNDRS
jgi:myo-inositol catabolism protein IolS